MRKSVKFIFALVMMLNIVFSMTVSASNSSVNGINTKKKDIITYTLNLADCDEPIVGLQMYIVYDTKYLRAVEDTFSTPQFANSVSSIKDGVITFNWTDVVNQVEFAEKNVMATIDFEVINKGETNITYFVSELYGEDMTYLKSYTFTYDLAVNGETKIEGQIPPISKDEELLSQVQGMFINFVDGKGEVNGANENVIRETVMGVTKAPENVETEAEETGEVNVTGIIIGCVVFILIALIIFMIILKNAMKRKNENNDK